MRDLKITLKESKMRVEEKILHSPQKTQETLQTDD